MSAEIRSHPRRWRALARTLRDSLSGKSHDYTRGSLPLAIVLLAIPMVLEMAMESVFAVCDVYFVSELGESAIAAVGLTESMVTIVFAFAIGFSMAATALVARRIGEGDRAGAGRAATQAIALATAFGVVTGIPCFLYAGDLLSRMGATPEAVEIGSGYTRLVMGGNVVIVLLFVNNAILRGAGDAALAMRALWIGNGVNLVLDPCLIFGLGPFPELGLTGGGIGTLVGRATGVAYQFWVLRTRRSRLVLEPSAMRLQPAVMLELLRLSAGGVAQFLIATASWVVLMRLVAPFGDPAVAGYTLAIRVIVFAILPSWGLSNAAATLVGQNLGANEPSRAERAVWLTGWFNAACMLTVMAVFLSLGPSIIRIFTSEAATLAHGADALRIVSYGYPFYAWGMVVGQAFNGAGDTWTPTRLNFVCFWLFQVPLAWMLSQQLGAGPSGVFWSVSVAESVLALAAIAIFRRGRWKRVTLAPDPLASTAA